jgi:hypothetical protein
MKKSLKYCICGLILGTAAISISIPFISCQPQGEGEAKTINEESGSDESFENPDTSDDADGGSNPIDYVDYLTFNVGDGEDAYAIVTKLEEGKTETVTEIQIPSVVQIGEELLPVKEIDAKAFQNCSNLTKIVMTDVENIGNRAFENCVNLETIVLGNSLINIGEYAFSKCEKLEDITIPESVKTIEKFAFKGCSSLTKIDIANVETIGKSAFSGCSSLTKIDMTNVENIGNSAFAHCIKLKEVTINDVETIGQTAFYNCTSLEEVIIPNSVKTIGQTAFQKCSSLNKITFKCKPSDSLTLSKDIFKEISAGGTIILDYTNANDSDINETARQK